MTPFRAILIVTSLLLSGRLLYASSIEDLRNLVEEKKYAEAFELGKSMSAQESSNPDFDFLYGVSARKSGHPEVAIFALERVVINNPQDAVATYERGIALLEVRDLLSAKDSFQRVLSLNPTDDVKANTTKLLEITQSKLKKDHNPTYFSMQAVFDLGFSSNVNSGVTDIVEVPTGAPQVKDGYANFGIAALLKRKLSKKDAYFFSLSANNRKYFRSPNWDFNIFTGRAGVEFGLGVLQLRLPIETELTLNNYEVVRIMPSFGFELMRAWNENNLSTLGVKVRIKGYINPDNNHLSPRFSLQHQAFSLFPGFDLKGEVFFAPAFPYSSQPGSKVKCELGTRADAKWEFAESHLLRAGLQFQHFRFPVSSTPTPPRLDENFTARVGYEWHFAKNWFVGPLFLYTLNHSTDLERKYVRYQAQLGLRYEL